jgi:type I restriction enzyme M protein
MAIKKSELYASLWRSCDELRGGMDASQYKDYVLVLLFVKYVSDKAASQNHLLEVPPGGRFADMVALQGDREIGDKMNKIVAKLAETNDLAGVIDVADWNDADKLGKGKEMVDRLSNLVAIFDNPALDFRGNRAEGDDLLGDAYEYLMRHFATESGKSKGQFYTPAEVSRVIAKVIGVGTARSGSQTIHDPTCGSGSLLLKAHDEARSATGLDLVLSGQEIDHATRAIARMNMILHGCPTAEIWQDNTLSRPHFQDARTGALATFDFVVANPPFSNKAWTNGLDPDNDRYGRFAVGVPPQKNGDYAFLLHILACLNSTGKGAVILPHGVLFRGGAEATIRREVVRRGYLKGVIGLPANLFYGTGIPACILVLDKEAAATRKGIFLIDASRGFVKDGHKNRLRAQDIHKIVDTFTRQLEIPRYARMVSLTEIGDPRNDFNLNLPRYIDASEPEDLQDIDGHLRGGIPDRDLDALDAYWKVFPGVRAALFRTAGRSGYSELTVPTAELQGTIFGHPEFTAWSSQTRRRFARWRAQAIPRLRGIQQGDKPRALIDALAEDLLTAFQSAALIDAYDVYQHLMDHWAESMQDDVYLITSDGWRDAARPHPIEDRDKKSRSDFVLGKQRFKAELIPARLLIARHFAAEQAAVEELAAELAASTQATEELAETHGGEDGLLADAKNEKDKLTRASVAARCKEVNHDPDAVDERRVLHDYLVLADKESALAARVRAADEDLAARVAARYGELLEDDIKTLVVDDRWLAAMERAVQGELDRVSQRLTGRVRELAERYATPLPRLAADIAVIAARVDDHLQRMGKTWK